MSQSGIKPYRMRKAEPNNAIDEERVRRIGPVIDEMLATTGDLAERTGFGAQAFDLIKRGRLLDAKCEAS